MSVPPAGQGILVVVTGPSGVGKGTLIRAVRKRVPHFAYSVSATTRPKRNGERDGVDYYFLSPAEFDRRIAAGEFVEHARYADYQYGTLRSEVERHLRHGDSVALELEVQGARQVRRAIPEAALIFIAPPSEAALADRLRGRGTDSAEQVTKRLATAKIELAARHEFDVEIVNDDLDEAIDELTGIVEAAIAAGGHARG